MLNSTQGPTQHSRPPWTSLLLVASLYFAGAFLGQFLTEPGHPAATVWPPSGILVAVLLMNPRRHWIAFLASAFAANLLFDALHLRPIHVSAFYATGNCLTAMVGASLTARFTGVPLRLKRSRDFVALTMCSAVGSTVVSAVIGTGATALFGAVSNPLDFFLTWWSGDAVGVAIFAPLILSWMAVVPSEAERSLPIRMIERFAFLLATLSVALGVFVLPPRSVPAIEFAVALPLLWSAFRVELRFISLGIGLAFIVGLWGTTHGFGAFDHVNSPILEEAAAFQIFIFGISTVITVIRLLLNEQRLAVQEREESDRRFREMHERVQLLSVILAPSGSITFCNEYFLHHTGWKRDDVLGKDWFEMFMGADPVVRQRFERSIVTRTVNQREQNEIYTRAGSKLVVSWTHTALLDAQGALIGVSSLGEDISELRQKKHEYQTLLQTTSDGFCELDLSGNLLEVNAPFCTLVGYTRDELLQKEIQDLEAIETPIEIRRHIQELIEKGTLRFETRHRRKDGALVDLSVSTTYQNIRGGRIYAFFSDISDRKKASTDLARSEEKFRTLFENMAVGAFYQRADGTLIDVNDEALRILGLTRDQFLGRTSLHPEWRVELEDGTLLKGEDHSSMVALRTGTSVKDVVLAAYNPTSQSSSWMIVSAIPQFHEGESRPYQVFVTLQDITLHKAKDAALALSESRLRAAEKLTKTGHYEIDIPTGAAIWSDETFRIFGLDPARDKAPTVETYSNFLHPDDIKPVFDAFAESLSTGRDFDLEYRIGTAGGDVKFVHSRAEVKPEAGGRARTMFGTFQDITARKLADEKLRLSQEQFSGLFSHMVSGCSIQEIICDERGTPIDYVTLDVNPAFERLLGVSKDLVVGRRASEFLPEKELAEWVRLFGDVALHGGSSEYEQYSPLNRKYFEGKVFQLKHGQFVVTFEDVTERHKALEELRRTRDHLGAILESIADGVFVIDTSGKLVFVNDVLSHDSGYSSADEMVREFQAVSFLQRFDLINESGEFLALSDLPHMKVLTGKPAEPMTVGYRNKRSGETRWAIVNSRAIVDKAGQILEVVSVTSDLTRRKQAERVLEQTLERFRLLTENIADYILIVRQGRGIVYASESTRKVFGLSPSEFNGKGPADFVHPDDFKKVTTELQSIIDLPGSSRTLETRVKSNSGAYQIHEVTLSNMYNVPSIQGLVISGHDITERMLAGEKLRLSQQRLALHVEQTPLAVVEFDLTGCVREWNPGAVRVFGFTKEEAVGQYWHFIVPEPVWSQLDGVWEALVNQNGGSRSSNLNRTKDGRIIHCEWFNTPLVGADGKSIGVASLVMDITDRVKAEEESQRARQELERFFELVPDMVCVASSDGKFKKVNQAWTRTFGYSSEELVPRSFAEFLHPDDIEAIFMELEKLLAGGRTAKFVNRYRRKDGAYRHLEWEASPTVDGELFAAARDITDRILAEEHLRESEERYRLLHELAGVGIGYYSPEGVVISFNALASKYMNGDPAQFAGKSVYDLFPKDTADEYLRRIGKAAASAGVQEYEDRVELPSGPMWFLSAFTRIVDAAGIIQGVQIISRDITVRKAVESALQAQEKKFRALFEQAGDYSFVLTPTGNGDLRILEANELACTVHQYSRDEIIGKVISSIDPKFHELPVAHILQRLASGETMRFETVHRRRDGSTFPVDVSAKLVHVEGQGDLIFSMERDITERKKAEQRLRESEERFRSLVGSMDDIIYTLDNKQCYTGVFGRWIEAMNMKPADFIGKAVHEVFGDEGRSIHEVAVDRALVGTNVLYEWNRTVGSEVHWYQTSLSPLYDDAGEVEGIVGVGRDVTSVKRAESALRESESKYRSLFQDAAVPIWEEDFSEVKRYIEAARASGVTDFRDYFENKPEEVLRCAQAVKIINVNVESLRFFQVGSAEELVKNLPEYFLDESWEVFREEMIALAQGRFRFLSEISIRDLNGGRKELLLRLTIPAESRETFDRVIVSFIDITERSRMEAKLRELSEAVQQSPASIVITDVDGYIQYVNQTFEVVTGYAREEVLGKNPRFLKSGHTSAEEYRKMWETIRQGNVWRGEFRNQRKNGELFWEAATITPIRDSKGRITRFLGQKEDITQRKIFEEEIVTSRELLRQLATSIEKAREEERSEIAREVHDELGQLLSAIKMDVSTLLRRGFEEPANVGEMAVSIYDLIDRGIRAVQELAARLRPGILDDLGLVAALEWQAEDFERRTGIPCRAQLPKVEPIVGPDLATAIFRIFQELTTNIGRHAQATAVEVCFEEKDNALSLQVTDNGIGISPSVVDNSASIGLLGIRERLRSFNGSLEFSTPKSGGTSATVTIPMGGRS